MSAIAQHLDASYTKDAASWLFSELCYAQDKAQHSATKELYGIVASALRGLWVACAANASPREVVTIGPRIYRGIDLDMPVAVKTRRTTLADQLDDEAIYYERMGSSLGRLVAA